jgi:hypothetical protein
MHCLDPYVPRPSAGISYGPEPIVPIAIGTGSSPAGVFGVHRRRRLIDNLAALIGPNTENA